MEPVESPSLAAYLFVLCFFLVGPLLGLRGASIQRARGKSGALGFFAVVSVAWAGWFAAGVVLLSGSLFAPAWLEWVAPVGVVPGALAGGFVLRVLSAHAPVVRASEPWGKGKRIAAVLAVSVASVVLCVGFFRMNMSRARRELPPGAVLISERAWEATIPADYQYSLSARMTESEFREWVQALELVPTDDPRRYEGTENGTQCGKEARYFGPEALFRSWCY